jgi:hypothetical protein
VAVLRERADQQLRVVVALSRALHELSGRVEKLGDRRHGEGSKEGELESDRVRSNGNSKHVSR